MLYNELVSSKNRDELSVLVWTNPDRVSGQPCFAGTRVPISALFDYLEAGKDLDRFLTGFPSVRRDQAVQLLELAETSLLSDLKAA